jgi:hypothetical protein
MPRIATAPGCLFEALARADGTPTGADLEHALVGVYIVGGQVHQYSSCCQSAPAASPPLLPASPVLSLDNCYEEHHGQPGNSSPSRYDSFAAVGKGVAAQATRTHARGTSRTAAARTTGARRSLLATPVHICSGSWPLPSPTSRGPRNRGKIGAPGFLARFLSAATLIYFRGV